MRNLIMVLLIFDLIVDRDDGLIFDRDGGVV